MFIALAKILEHEGSISRSTFYGQLPNYWSHLFSLICPVHCRCMELVAVGWCTRKWLRLHQTIRNLTSGDLGIMLVVIRLGVTRLKKTRVLCLSELFEGRGEKGQCDLVCVEHLSMTGLMVVMLMCY